MHSAEYLDTLPPLPKKSKEKMKIQVPFGLYILYTDSFIHQICLYIVLCNEKTNEMKIQKEKV